MPGKLAPFPQLETPARLNTRKCLQGLASQTKACLSQQAQTPVNIQPCFCMYTLRDLDSDLREERR